MIIEPPNVCDVLCINTGKKGTVPCLMKHFGVFDAALLYYYIWYIKQSTTYELCLYSYVIVPLMVLTVLGDLNENMLTSSGKDEIVLLCLAINPSAVMSVLIFELSLELFIILA